MHRYVRCGLLLTLFAVLRPSAADPPRDLQLAWDNTVLTIRGSDIPGGEVKVRYLEAYCRPGSTDRDGAAIGVHPPHAWFSCAGKPLPGMTLIEADQRRIEAGCGPQFVVRGGPLSCDRRAAAFEKIRVIRGQGLRFRSACEPWS